MISSYLLVQEASETPFPVAPSRSAICGVQMTFSGLYLDSEQYGRLPWFEPAVTALNASDRQRLYAAKRAAGDTHLNIAWSWNYAEPGQPYGSGNLVPPCDYSQDVPALKALIREVIANGFWIYLTLAGDGQSDPGWPRTPIGWTYGHQWLMANFPRLVAGLQADEDLTPYIVFSPGYDGVFYGWEPDQVANFGVLFRSLLPTGYLAIEHDIGHIPVGGGETGRNDYAPGGPMVTYDVILGEFDYPTYQADSTWQILGRMIRPYHRPPDQPTWDDPNPPFYLASESPRGPYTYVALEVGEYQWVRGQVTPAQLKQAGDYFRAMGARFVGLP